MKTSTASGSLTFNETQNATLVCIVSGCPLPTVKWSKDGVELNKTGSTFTIMPPLRASDAGRYSCFAYNAYANSSSQIDVTINCEYQCVLLCNKKRFGFKLIKTRI